MTDTAPHCGLCRSPKVNIRGVWMCNHCDSTNGCSGPASQCGGCRLAAAKRYPHLPDPND